MSLATIDRELATQRASIASIVGLVNSASSVSEVQNIRAKAESLKAWAKIHKQTKTLRLDLLRVEIAALVQIFRLGGRDDLTPAEYEAAEWWASLAADEIDSALASESNTTTAAGLYRKIQQVKETKERRTAETNYWSERFKGQAASRPSDPAEDEAEARRSAAGMRVALDEVLDTYERDGESFTPSDIAEELLDRASFVKYQDDDVVMDGLKEAIRKTIGRQSIEMWDGVKVPKFITTRVTHSGEERAFVRIPVLNAKVCDVSDMVALREEQLREDAAALDRLRAFLDKLNASRGATPESNIGEIFAGSVTQMITNEEVAA